MCTLGEGILDQLVLVVLLVVGTYLVRLVVECLVYWVRWNLGKIAKESLWLSGGQIIRVRSQ